VYYEDDGESYQYESGNFFKRTISLEPQKRQLTFAKTEGTFDSKFKKVKVLFHGFSDFKGVGAKSENFSFMEPLPHFDPTGSGQPAPACGVKTLVLDFGKEAFSVKY
jgi:alpha-glucosidase